MNIGIYKAVKLTKDRINDVLNLCNTYLGKGLYNYSILENIIDYEHHYFYILYYESKIIGIFYCYVDFPDQINTDLSCDLFNISDKKERVGIYRSIAICKEYRRKGIAKIIVDYFSDMLCRSEKVSEIYALAWVNGQTIPAAHHLNLCGFEKVRLIEKPWNRINGLVCPACHREKCECNGVLYCKEIMGEHYENKK